jgi:hypothetical protein
MSDLIPCSKCKSVDTCEITYGYPGDIEEYLKLVAEKKIHPGDGTQNENSPTIHCNNCNNQWRNSNEKTDSFDFDQGFNLDEVYD